MTVETLDGLTPVLPAIAESLEVRSVLELTTALGNRVCDWSLPGIAYRRAAVDGGVHGHADLAAAELGSGDDLGRLLRAVFAAASRYVVLRLDRSMPPSLVTDWVALYHRDFTEIQRRDDVAGEVFVFERRVSRRHTLPGHLVVSLTSYAARFDSLELMLRSILQQTVRADEVVLWLAPGDMDLLPPEVVDLERQGLTIRLTEDLRSYKKIVPALRAYPESFILLLDDDLVVPIDLIEPLVAAYRSPNEILCRRAHMVRYDDLGHPLSYREWHYRISPQPAHPDIFPTTGHGTLYPPHSLHPQVTDATLFTRLAPTADDVWLYWMARRAGSETRVIGPIWESVTWPGSQGSALADLNWQGGNDRQIAAMFDFFGRPTPLASSTDQESAVESPYEGFSSAEYWSQRYAQGGNSGAGSYGRLAEFKAEVLNGFVAERGIETVIEFGSGDGAQLALAEYPHYIGFDVAQPCIDSCRELFADDTTKSFEHTDHYAGHTADLVLSLDVIYHLVEDEVFEEYMARLFDASKRYVIVYASNIDQTWPVVHVRHRKFTDWVERERPDFALVEQIPNRYPLVSDELNETFADFYIFQRVADGEKS